MKVKTDSWVALEDDEDDDSDVEDEEDEEEKEDTDIDADTEDRTLDVLYELFWTNLFECCRINAIVCFSPGTNRRLHLPPHIKWIETAAVIPKVEE